LGDEPLDANARRLRPEVGGIKVTAHRGDHVRIHCGEAFEHHRPHARLGVEDGAERGADEGTAVELVRELVDRLVRGGGVAGSGCRER